MPLTMRVPSSRAVSAPERIADGELLSSAKPCPGARRRRRRGPRAARPSRRPSEVVDDVDLDGLDPGHSCRRCRRSRRVRADIARRFGLACVLDCSATAAAGTEKPSSEVTIRSALIWSFDGVADSTPHAVREHCDEGDECEADHQGGRGRSGAPRIALCIAPQRAAGDAANPRAGNAHDFASGTTRRDESMATPMNSDNTPMPSRAEALARGDVVGESRPYESAARRAPRSRPRCKARNVASLTARERRALANGERSAGRAWRAAPGREPRTPSRACRQEATRSRCARRRRSASGRSRLSTSKSLFRPTASPRPANEPDDGGDEADHQRLHDHEMSGPAGAKRRSSAASPARAFAARP